MYAIIHIHAKGGVSSVSGKTLKDVRNAAQRKLSYFANFCIVATVPFECKPAADGVGWDASLPQDIRDALGEDLMHLYAKND